MPPPTLLVIDGPSQAYQAFYAIRGLHAPDGRPSNAVYGVVATLRKVLRELDPAAAAVAWDPPGPTFRHEQDPTYKATRSPMPEDLVSQLESIREVIRAHGIPIVEAQGFEADDVMATLARRGAQAGYDVVLATRDKDAKQLLGDHVRMWDTKTGEYFTAKDLRSETGLGPEQMVDAQALMGDSTDNVKGVPGIGPKTAYKLIAEHGSLDGIYQALDRISAKRTRTLLEKHREEAYHSRELVRLREDTPVPELAELERGAPDQDRLAQLFRDLGFRRFLEEATETPETRGDYGLCHDEASLREAVASLGRPSLLAVDTETTSADPMQADLVGISFAATARTGFYVPVRSPGVTVNLETVREVLGALLADEGIPKVGQNAKYDLQILEAAGLPLRGLAHDTMLMAYLLNPGARSFGMDALALENLGYKCIPLGDLIGSGKQQRSPAEVEVARMAEYAAEDADITLRLAEVLWPRVREEGLEEVYRDLEMPLVPILARMEAAGITLDTDRLSRLSEELGGEMARIEEAAHREAGEPFNLASPKQLQKILYEKRELPVLRRTKTGPSTDAETLGELVRQHDDVLARLMLEHRMLAKLKSTYADALPGLVNPRTGRIHTSFHQTGAATGRLSSSDPNLQNIPVRTELGREIRRAFVAGGPDLCLLSADYSQIELRVLAHLSRDEALTDAFARGVDVHDAVAARIHGLDPDEVPSELRRQAKAVNYGIVYGLTPFGLGRDLGIPTGEAKRFIDTYFAEFSGVRSFIDATIEEAREKGEVRTLLGRRRPIPELRSRGGPARALGERLAINTVVQGSAADLMKRAMIALDHRLHREGSEARILLQIHDELILEAPEAEAADVTRMVREEMTGALPLEVPLVVDTARGRTWGDLEK